MPNRIVGRIVLAILLLCNGWLTCGVSRAERGSPNRIGVLTPSWGPTPQVVGLRDGLLALGYREDKDFVLGIRFTQGDIAALETAARELVADGVDLLVADGDASVQATRRATTQIPIVFISAGQPVQMDLVQSFAQPGGNITGVSDLDLELTPKRLELFRDMLPNLQRVLFLYDAADTYAALEVKVFRDAARHLGIELVEKAVQTVQEAQATLATMANVQVDGILSPRQVYSNIPGVILEVATQRAIPTMYSTPFMVEQGGLASYSPASYKTGRQAARLVDKILKGTKPADIPVEVNSHIEFVINVKTAKALGLTIPPEVLYQADRLIR